jgi:hypothetical protein
MTLKTVPEISDFVLKKYQDILPFRETDESA